jgi:hypothetical protein
MAIPHSSETDTLFQLVICDQSGEYEPSMWKEAAALPEAHCRISFSPLLGRLGHSVTQLLLGYVVLLQFAPELDEHMCFFDAEQGTTQKMKTFLRQPAV